MISDRVSSEYNIRSGVKLGRLMVSREYYLFSFYIIRACIQTKFEIPSNTTLDNSGRPNSLIYDSRGFSTQAWWSQLYRFRLAQELSYLIEERIEKIGTTVFRGMR